MSRLKYQVGNHVTIDGVDSFPTISFVVVQVQPALELPYLLSNDVWYDESLLTTYVEPTPTWEEVESHVKHIVEELRETFKGHDESHLNFKVEASGRPDGDIKIKYTVCDNAYSSAEVNGYSLRPTLDEFFRRKVWKSRNEPLALTHAGKSDA